MNGGWTVEKLVAFEKEIAELFNAGKIRAPVHLEGGNERQLLHYFEKIDPQDWVLGAWRMHYKCLLKGVPPEILREDILAGKSITLCYPQYKILSSAIVGGCLPIAVGIASAIKRRGGKERVWAFVGDMTATTGIYHECYMYARGHGLPLVIVVENNDLSVSTPTRDVWDDGSDSSGFGVVSSYDYKLPWPHSGAGRRVEF